MSTASSDRPGWTCWVFLGVLAATVTDRLFLLWHFGIAHTGSDDVLFWEVARDMASGHFREPFLYGQNYNPALESLLAVPLLWVSVPFHVAMPVVTSMLALAPFLSFAYWHYRRRAFASATLFAAIPLLLPVEWGLMTMITRGFVSGLALLAALPWLCGIRNERIRALALGTTLSAAIFVNPHALLFAAPYFIRSILQGSHPWRYALYAAFGALPMLGLHSAAMRFYETQPERVVHRLDDWRLDFHPVELIPEALAQLDVHFAWLHPVWWPNGQMVLWSIALVAIVLVLARRWNEGVAVASVLPIVLVSLGFPKVHDGFHQVFYPYARMYLAMPLVLAWSLTLIPSHKVVTKVLLVAIGMVAPLFLVLKMGRTSDVIASQLAAQQNIPVREVTVSALKAEVQALKETAARTGAELIVCFDRPEPSRSLLLTHGGPCLHPDLPPTLYVGIDRRWWRRQAERDGFRTNILFVGGTAEEWHTLRGAVPGIEVVFMGKDSAHFIADPGLPLNELMAHMGRRID